MPALCLMLSKTYYAQIYAGIIGLGLYSWSQHILYPYVFSRKGLHWWKLYYFSVSVIHQLLYIRIVDILHM